VTAWDNHGTLPCIDACLLSYLTKRGHGATRIHKPLVPTLSLIRRILAIAWHEQRIRITDDRDFGELVFRLQLPHAGVIFLSSPKLLRIIAFCINSHK
jgi:hypothetical protein